MADPNRKPVSKLVDVKLTEISLVDRPANQGSTVVLFKRDDSEEQPMPGENQTLEQLTEAVQKAEEALGQLTEANDDLTATNQQLTEELGRLTAELAKRDEQITSLKKNDGGETEEQAIEKALGELPPALAGLFKSMQTRLSVAEGVVAKASRDKELVVFIAKAEHFDALPTTAEKLGGLLLRVAKAETTAEDADELERILKAAQEAMQDGSKTGKARTTEIGKRGNDDGATAEQRIDAAAVELMKSDKGLTKEQAVSKALEENPELYDAYVAESRG